MGNTSFIKNLPLLCKHHYCNIFTDAFDFCARAKAKNNLLLGIKGTGLSYPVVNENYNFPKCIEKWIKDTSLTFDAYIKENKWLIYGHNGCKKSRRSLQNLARDWLTIFHWRYSYWYYVTRVKKINARLNKK